MGGLLSFLTSSTPQGAAAEVAGRAAEGLLAGVGDAAIKIRQAIKGKELDPAVAADLEKTAMALDAAQLTGQMAINLEDAKRGGLWQSGWRPNVGWACGAAIWYTWLVQPFVAFTVQAIAWRGTPHGTPFPPLPVLSMSDIIGLLMALLGMGTLRTFEKTRG